MAFLLTYLGTDTQYKPEHFCPAEGVVLNRGETLSYLHSRIEDPTRSNYPPAKALQTESVDDEFEACEMPDESQRKAYLLNGPQTDGGNLYEIIGQGVVEAIKAIARGETTINMIGHSRGGVESILTAHELDRIKTAFGTEEITSKADLLNLFPQYSNVLPENLAIEDFKKNLAKTRVNVFAIDPVPGGSWQGITAGRIKDDRYYKIPAIVQDFREILLEDERTRCFKPIVPEVVDAKATKRTLINLPGHHGHANGNPHAQDGKTSAQLLNPEIAGKEASTTEVQDITLYLLIEFLEKHDVAFNTLNEEENELHAIFDDYVKALVTDRLALKLAVYQKILDNRDVYALFRETCYSILGREEDLQAFFGMARSPARLIHYHNPADTLLSSVVSACNGFVNVDHATSFLRHHFHLNASDGAAKNLIDILKKFRESERKTLAILRTHTDVSESIQKSMQALLSSLVEKYIRNHITENEKTLTIQAINEAFEFSQIGQDVTESTSKFLDKLVKPLQQHLVDTLFSNIDLQVQSNFKDLSTIVFALSEARPQEAFIAQYPEEEREGINLFDFIHQKVSYLEMLSQNISDLAEQVQNVEYKKTLQNAAKRLSFYSQGICYFYVDALVLGKLSLPEETEENSAFRSIMLARKTRLETEPTDVTAAQTVDAASQTENEEAVEDLSAQFSALQQENELIQSELLLKLGESKAEIPVYISELKGAFNAAQKWQAQKNSLEARISELESAATIVTREKATAEQKLNVAKLAYEQDKSSFQVIIRSLETELTSAKEATTYESEASKRSLERLREQLQALTKDQETQHTKEQTKHQKALEELQEKISTLEAEKLAQQQTATKAAKSQAEKMQAEFQAIKDELSGQLESASHRSKLARFARQVAEAALRKQVETLAAAKVEEEEVAVVVENIETEEPTTMDAAQPESQIEMVDGEVQTITEPSNHHSYYLMFEILSGVGALVGIVALTLAVAALAVGGFGIVPAAVTIAVGTGVAAAGLFGVHHCAQAIHAPSLEHVAADYAPR